MSLFCPECQTNYGDESMAVCPNDGTRLYRVDDDDPLIGGVIDGRFRVDYTLGIGGMGTVYGGVQLSVNRDVAIKVLRTELATREVALERFFREAKTISKLSHPNIVSLVEFGQDRDRGLLYLVMELVRGQNLADLIAKGRVRIPLALEVIYQVCGALTEPHSTGVIHRDLKPDNLLLVPVTDGTIQTKVLDFGIARFMESNTQLTGTGMICGTPAYMAPEQAQNETLGSRTDLYALGVILYEMLSGWPPFSGTSSLQIMLKHIQEQPKRLRDLLPPAALPDVIEELAYSLMSKERSARPESARFVRDEIESIRKRLDIAPVRVQPAPQLEEQFEPFVLPKLPRPDKEQSGPTQVLRRETGLEEALASASHPDPAESQPTTVWRSETEADESLGVTGPLTPEGKKSVLGDAEKVKLGTREGGQQAWTPGDQNAVHAIKDTTENVDAFGATAASAPSVETEAEPRKTLVEAENSDAILDVPPVTEESLEAARPDVRHDPDRTVTSERKEARTTNSNTPLVVAAILGGAMAIGAAVIVVQKIDDVVSGANAAPPSAPAAPAPEAPTDETAATPAESEAETVAAFVSAQFNARSHVHRGVAAGAGEQKARAERPAPSGESAKKSTPPAKEPAPKTDESTREEASAAEKPEGDAPQIPKSKRPKDIDSAIESLGLTGEDG